MMGRTLLAATAMGLGAAFGGFLAPAAWNGGSLRLRSTGRRAGYGWTNAHAQRVARKRRAIVCARKAQRRRGR